MLEHVAGHVTLQLGPVTVVELLAGPGQQYPHLRSLVWSVQLLPRHERNPQHAERCSGLTGGQ